MALFRGHKPLLFKYTTSPSGFTYDMFLSFRGKDTRKNFTGHLYTALVNAGYRTFLDDPELERGENIKEKLENAIQQSRSSVIVFSEDYTSSRWCLDELVMILERKRTSDHAVLPVFYKVDPSEVRKQAKSLAGVRKYHEIQSSEKLNEWRAALGEVADLAGMVSENEADGYACRIYIFD
ncbi:PREDICTED: TMV resistance protein N-like [Fragaria vesca subsp. vesca]